MEKVVMELIESNKQLFSKQELELINNNFKTFYKLYVVGVICGKEVYGNN